jgi:hypothetical protein
MLVQLDSLRSTHELSRKGQAIVLQQPNRRADVNDSLDRSTGRRKSLALKKRPGSSPSSSPPPAARRLSHPIQLYSPRTSNLLADAPDPQKKHARAQARAKERQEKQMQQQEEELTRALLQIAQEKRLSDKWKQQQALKLRTTYAKVHSSLDTGIPKSRVVSTKKKAVVTRR